MKDRCPCGGIILADTEDWHTPLCHDCWVPYTRVDVPGLIILLDLFVDSMDAVRHGAYVPIKETCQPAIDALARARQKIQR